MLTVSQECLEGMCVGKKNFREGTPKSSRPRMPGYEMMFDKGKGSLPWSWAAACLSKAHNYWVATTRPDGRPHVMPVWGVWVDDAFYFSTGRKSRKSRNLSVNANCVVCPEGAVEATILEGIAEEVTEPSVLRRFAGEYKKKYDWDMEGNEGPVYAVRPRVVFGFIEESTEVQGNPTRWLFDNTK
jgi:nitroimidazol reductase NimA-like FMN-containing flavoprotein (pyridoxamine 5'-phosphate oxidase superfamily)